MLVRNWMTRAVVTISPEESLLTAQEVMAERGIRRLPVVEEGRLIGIITQADILREVPGEAPEGLWEFDYLHPLAKRTVREAMTPDPLTVTPEATLEEAALLMREHKIGGLPVVANGKLVGIITESDIFAAMIEILGFRWGGVRLDIEVEDRPGALLQVLEALRRHEVGVISLASCRSSCTSGQTREVMLRLEGEPQAVEDLLTELRQEGITVRDVRHLEQNPHPSPSQE